MLYGIVTFVLERMKYTVLTKNSRGIVFPEYILSTAKFHKVKSSNRISGQINSIIAIIGTDKFHKVKSTVLGAKPRAQEAEFLRYLRGLLKEAEA